MKEGIITLYDFFNGNRLFYIPQYQRNYAWTKEKQLNDFWDDLFYLDEDKKYFFGTILLRKNKDELDDSGLVSFEKWEIIDGQQRSITTCIFIKVLLQKISSLINNLQPNDAKIKVLEKYIEERNEIYLLKDEKIKLTPLGDDKSFYEQSIINYQELPDDTITPSQRRIKEAKQFFIDKTCALELNELISLVKKIEKARIVIYPVVNRDESVLIFETVNDRGKPLSNLEKIKSFLMYVIYLSSEESYKVVEDITQVKNHKQLSIAKGAINKAEKTLKDVENIFGTIFRYLDALEKNKVKADEDDILRYHYALWDTDIKGSYDGSFDYLNNLKKYFRSLIISHKDRVIVSALGYVKSLEKAFFAMKEIFVDIKSQTKYDAINKRMTNIIGLGRLGNFYPLLIASWLRYRNSPNYLLKLYENIEKYVFRVYIIGNKRSDAGVNQLYEAAYLLNQNKIEITDNIRHLKELAYYYISDEEFERSIRHPNFYGNLPSKEIRFIFYYYETSLRKNQKEPIEFSLETILSDRFNVEHVLADGLDVKERPKDLKADKIWRENVNKLGNLTLCSQNWNSSLGKKRFKLKVNDAVGRVSKPPYDYPCYHKSIFKCQQNLTKYSEFGLQQIIQRENELFEFIQGVWDFN